MIDNVILVVYGWKNVQPGTLSWVFPSMAAAVHAAHTMTNAARWAIVRGAAQRPNVDTPGDLAKARAAGSVLVEQAG